jgi:radical SAM protein with 4Fe4S-binding SPASM domain
MKTTAMINIRNIKNILKEPCKTCRINTSCYGCRADAEGLTDNIFEKDQYCWRCNNEK